MELTSETVTPPAAWALSQRRLISTMNDAAPVFQARYTRPDGSFIWKSEWPGMDGSDDGYESYGNWPLFYALGSSGDIHERSRFLWDAVTRQFTGYGQVHREFDAYYDWMHHGESSLYLYYFGLADPHRQPDRARALRFASMFTGDDPLAPNWDRARGQMRSPINGSRGPRFKNSAGDWETHRWVLHEYPVPFQDLNIPLRRERWIGGELVEKADWMDDAVFDRILEAMNERMMSGDIPLNLTASSLVTHAYILAGKSDHRSWVLDYLEQWAERMLANDDICPDNVGPGGEVGELMNGKWWGGYYGWSWPHGLFSILEPLTIAAMNAVLLTGDMSYLEIPRRQIDASWELGREEDGKWLVPHRRTDAGWTSYRPFNPKHLIQIWAMSQADEDLQRIWRLPEAAADWRHLEEGSGKGDDLHPGPWLLFLQGELPDYPLRILENQWREVLRRMDAIRSDEGDPEQWDVHHWQNVNPVRTEALLQLTCGSPQVIYHGGLLHSPLRYFDSDKARPGLPPDVAALVEGLTADQITIALQNTSLLAERRLIIQAGAFAEHRFDRVEVLDRKDSVPERVAEPHLTIRLPPGRGMRIRLCVSRYCNSPSYEQPV